MHISKSRFLHYIQCPRRYWFGIYQPELADERDMSVFASGTRVGEFARGIFPGGVLLERRREGRPDLERMQEETREHIAKGTRILYEAAFATDDLMAICDILVRTKDGYDIYEVKSSGSVKDVYLPDAAFQYHVLKEWGLPVNRVFVTTMNTGYVRRGELEPEKMFTQNDLTKEVIRTEKEIKEAIPDIKDTYALKMVPDVLIGEQCETPYTCEYMGHCFRHIGEDSVFDIAGMHKDKKYRLYGEGLVYFSDIEKAGTMLNKGAMQQMETALSGEEIIASDEINEFLHTLHYPLYFLDFETINPAIPLYDGTSPYEQIPTQYSLHFIEEEGGMLHHREFLAETGTDPRRELAKRLAADIPEDSCVLAYHMAFEKKVTANLAGLYPDLRERLMRIHGNMRDLILPFRKRFYYTKEMKGRSSIKSVLPALFPDDPELSYEFLQGIHNGSEASDAYQRLEMMSEEERQTTKRQLLEYCKLDTLAMVRLWEKLKLLK